MDELAEIENVVARQAGARRPRRRRATSSSIGLDALRGRRQPHLPVPRARRHRRHLRAHARVGPADEGDGPPLPRRRRRRRAALNEEMAPAFELLKIQTNPIPIKAAMNLLGHELGGYRLPMVEPTEEELAQVRACLERARRPPAGLALRGVRRRPSAGLARRSRARRRAPPRSSTRWSRVAREAERARLRLRLALRPPPARRADDVRGWTSLAAIARETSTSGSASSSRAPSTATPALLAKMARDARRRERRPLHPRPRRRLGRGRVRAYGYGSVPHRRPTLRMLARRRSRARSADGDRRRRRRRTASTRIHRAGRRASLIGGHGERVLLRLVARARRRLQLHRLARPGLLPAQARRAAPPLRRDRPRRGDDPQDRDLHGRRRRARSRRDARRHRRRRYRVLHPLLRASGELEGMRRFASRRDAGLCGRRLPLDGRLPDHPARRPRRGREEHDRLRGRGLDRHRRRRPRLPARRAPRRRPRPARLLVPRRARGR